MNNYREHCDGVLIYSLYLMIKIEDITLYILVSKALNIE